MKKEREKTKIKRDQNKRTTININIRFNCKRNVQRKLWVVGKVKSVHETTRNNKSKVDDLKFINGYEWKSLPGLEKY